MRASGVTTGALMAVALGLTASLVAAPASLEAQGATTDRRISVDGRVGIGIPIGDLGDLADVGPVFGIGAAYRISDRIRFRVDGDVQVYSGASFDAVDRLVDTGPDVTLYHYRVGVEYALTNPDRSPFSLAALGGLGGTTFDTDAFMPERPGVPGGGVRNPQTGEVVSDFSETYFLLTTGLRAGYDLTRRLQVFLQGEGFITFSDEEDTAVFTRLSGADVGPIDPAVSIPFSVGVRFAF